jgi:hypothetical protein
MTTRWLFALISCAFAVSSSAQPAAMCDVKLFQETTLDDTAEDLRLSVLSLITAENFSEAKKTYGVDLVLRSSSGSTIGGFGDYSTFDVARTKELNLFEYKFDRKISRHFVQSRLTDRSVEAYSECLRSISAGGLFLWFSNVTDDYATLNVYYKAFPGDGSNKKLELLEVVGAANKLSLEQDWQPNVTRKYQVKRKPASQLRVSMNMAGTSDEAVVPYLPPPTVVWYSYDRLDYLGYFHSAPVDKSPRFCVANDCQSKARDVCKALKHNAVLGFTTRDEGRAVHDVICK